MLSRVAFMMLATLCPLLAAAQSAAPASTGELRILQMDTLLAGDASTTTLAGSASQVVPLWASQDGRLLAIVGLAHGNGAPTLPPSPAFGGLSDLRIIDATDLFSTGLRWRIGSALRADVAVGLQSSGALSSSPLASLACADNACLPGVAAYLPNMLAGTIGAGWTSASNRMDLSFGLTWLDARDTVGSLLTPGGFAASGFDLAVFALPGNQALRLDSAAQASARGSWQLERGPRIDLAAGLGRAQLAPSWYGAPGGAFDASQASLELGIASGSLRGSIVGHVISAEEASAALGTRRWSGLDLGVSWRTPWRGEVSLGAQNLWSLPVDTNATRDADSAQARMPYVQYRQDL